MDGEAEWSSLQKIQGFQEGTVNRVSGGGFTVADEMASIARLVSTIKEHVHDVNNQLAVLKGKNDKLMDDEIFRSNMDFLKINEKTNNIIALIRQIRVCVKEFDKIL